VANVVVIWERVRRALEVRRDLQRHAARTVRRAARERDRLVLGTGSYAGAPDIAVSRGDPDHRVVVGNYSSIADEVTFLIGGEHHPEWVSTFPFRIKYGLPGRFEDGQPHSRGPITIGSDVWIGRGAILASGVTIGGGAVVVHLLCSPDVEGLLAYARRRTARGPAAGEPLRGPRLMRRAGGSGHG
jgi:acetyltransferase-like isoleucine patch superfamily enzyme